MSLDNPAGRLHDLLAAYQQTADPNKTIHATWATTLGVPEPKVLTALAEVASLVPAIEQAVFAVGDDSQRTMYEQFSHKWAAPIVQYSNHPRTTPSPGPGLVDGDALVALGALSSYLSLRVPEGAVPDSERRSELRGEVVAAIDALREDRSVPSQLATAINHRLHDVLWAMDHIRTGGPGAVEQATERLLGEVVLSSKGDSDVRKSGVLRRTLDVAGNVWFAFKFVPEAQTAVEGWQNILGELPMP